MTRPIIPPLATAAFDLDPVAIDPAFLAACRPPPGPRQVDLAVTLASGQTKTFRALFDEPSADATRWPFDLVAGPRMANGAWSPPEVYRHAAEIDGKLVTVEIRRAER